MRCVDLVKKKSLMLMKLLRVQHPIPRFSVLPMEFSRFHHADIITLFRERYRYPSY
jgi:hypothetical protein